MEKSLLPYLSQSAYRGMAEGV